ncbi:MAG TPA: hypothetical protein VGK49_04720, partial [Ilumatobacteraceae bacterium]
GVAGAGSSIWHVPAGGSNTAAVLVDGERVTSAPSTNLICFALVANSVCDVDAATTTVTWAINSNQAGLQLVVGDARGLAFAPNPIPPFGSATAVEVIAGPLVEQSISNTVLLQAGDRQSSSYSASLTIGACTGPSSLPDVTFTFTTRANSARASLGDTVSYEYCGQNTSDIPLEVVRLVDDRLGVLIELPSVTTIVEPGASLCNSDVGVAVEYVVIDADIGTTIANNAVVTVRTREPSPRTFQATSSAAVDVPILASLSAFMITSYGAEDVKICHATGAEGHWTTQFVDQSAATEGTGGHNEDNHQGGRDIIPPGPWDPDGRNWDAAAEVIWTYGCARPPTSPVAPTVTHATCAGGGVTNPIVLFDASLGIVYSANPPAPYSGTEGATVVVTATLKPGWQWGQIPKGWTASGADYQMTVVLSPSSCTAVAPVAPAVTQAVCHMGTEIPPTLVLAITDQIVYTTTPPAPYAAGTTVVVTATLAATGVAFPAALPPGWRLVDATHAAYDVRLDPSGCTPLQPLAPEIAPATCVNGRVTTPTVTPAVLPSGVVYLVVPDTPQDGSAGVTITVFAVVAPGYGWGQMPPGWVRVDDTKARFDA